MGKLGELARRGMSAPVRALLPKNPWIRLLVIALPILLIAAFLEPVLNLLARGLDLVLRTFTPLLDNPVGRLILLNLLLIFGVAIVWYMLRGRFRALCSTLVLRHHLSGVAVLVADPAKSRQLFRKVARSRAKPPAEYPAAKADAMIKLARLSLDASDYDGALAWLTRVRDKGLPKELRRSVLQLRAEAAIAQGVVLAESVERELREGLVKFPDDLKLLALLRQLLIDAGNLDEAAQLQEKIAKKAPAGRREVESERYVDDLVRAGEWALGQKDHKRAMRFAKKAHGTNPVPSTGCLMGQIRLAEGDLKGAVREWGATRSPEGLDLMAELLDEHPGGLSPRELLECSPTEGCLLLVAREYARAGDADRALRAARRAARALGPLPSVTAVLAEVLDRCGKPEEARALEEKAVLHLLEPSVDAPGST